MAIHIISADRKIIEKNNYNRNDNNNKKIIIYYNTTPKIENNNNTEIRKINKFAFSNLYQNHENLSVNNNYYNFKINNTFYHQFVGQIRKFITPEIRKWKELAIKNNITLKVNFFDFDLTLNEQYFIRYIKQSVNIKITNDPD